MSLRETSHDPVLVTGASGFIGSRIVRELIDRGHEVIAAVRSTRADRRCRLDDAIEQARPGQLRVLVADLLDSNDRRMLVANAGARSCVHAAWDVTPPGYLDRPGHAEWRVASEDLVEMLGRHGCRWTGLIGTSAEPFIGSAPASRYAQEKNQLARAAIARSRDDHRIAWLRVFQPYGRGEHESRLIPSMIMTLLRGEVFVLHRPTAVRDFVHIDDVARGVTAAQETQASGIFDIGAGVGVTLRSVGLRIAALMSRPASLVDDSATAAPGSDPTRLVANTGPLTRMTAWRPLVTLDDGLARLIAEMRDTVREDRSNLSA